MQLDVQVNIQYTLYIVRYVNNNDSLPQEYGRSSQPESCVAPLASSRILKASHCMGYNKIRVGEALQSWLSTGLGDENSRNKNIAIW